MSGVRLYAHFRGKDELLLSGFEEFKNASTAEKRNDERAADKFGFDSLKMFQHAHEHRRIYRALAGRSGGDLFLKQMFRQHHEICLEEFRRAVAPEKEIRLKPKRRRIFRRRADFFADFLARPELAAHARRDERFVRQFNDERRAKNFESGRMNNDKKQKLQSVVDFSAAVKLLLR